MTHTHTNAHGCLLSPESFIAKRLISKISESHIEDIPYHSKFVQNRRIIVQNNLALTPFSYYVNLNWIYIINTITKMIIYNWIWMIFGLETPRKSIHPHFEGNMCNLNTLIWSVAPRGEATHTKAQFFKSYQWNYNIPPNSKFADSRGSWKWLNLLAKANFAETNYHHLFRVTEFDRIHVIW